MKARIGGIQTLALAETDGVSLNIYLQGCLRRCKGCHNPQFWPLNGGKEIGVLELVSLLEEMKPYHDTLCFLGGEPLLQTDIVEVLANYGKEMGYTLWLFTGYEVFEIPPNILPLFDVIKCGPYIEELRTEGFPASSNQYILRKER
jgi:anaerobic ribonucleoside-triphosphate reductase activating protein